MTVKQKSWPLVTVIIPSYNHARWISCAINSVLEQTYENTELIVVDDASTDDSRSVIASFLHDSRVRTIFKDANAGQGNSLNLAIAQARGKYISILPSDDWFLPRKTALQVRIFEDLPESVGLIYGRGLRYYEDTRQTRAVSLPEHRGWVLEELILNGNFVYPASTMIRRSVFNDIRFNEAYRAEGESIFVRIAERYEFDYVAEDVVVMRAHGYNTGSKTYLMYGDNIKWWTEYFLSSRTPNHVKRFRRPVLARLHRMYGLSFLVQHGDGPRSIRALGRAVILKLDYLLDPRVVSAFLLACLPAGYAKRLITRVKDIQNSSASS